MTAPEPVMTEYDRSQNAKWLIYRDIQPGFDRVLAVL